MMTKQHSVVEDVSNFEESIPCMNFLLRWFTVNSFRANPGKFRFIILGKSLRP